LFFTGDYYKDGAQIARFLKVPFFCGVPGNCDSSSRRKTEQIKQLEGVKFYLVHGHQYRVKTSLNALFLRGQEVGAEVVLFGHTHIPFCEKIEGMWMINPGSPSLPRSAAGGSFILAELNNSVFNPQLIML
jgi:putative phosphoesterase